MLCFSLFYYQIIKGEYYLERAKNNYVKIIPLNSIRGTIYDRNSTPIAYDKAAFNIAVIPYQIQNKKKYIFSELSKLFNCNEKEIYKNYNKRLTNIFTPVDIIIDIDKMAALKAKEKFGEDILINPQPKRFYPTPYESAHVLGYVKPAVSLCESFKKYGYTPTERIGFTGIEQYYDAYLVGASGGNSIEVDAKGKTVGFLGERKPQAGKDIYLTIDNRIQKAAFNVLEKRKGVIILLDSQKGDIISLVSSPSFDSNDFIRGLNISELFRDKNNPLIDRAIQAAYPLGSTFKPILSVAALEKKKIIPETTFVCHEKMNIGSASFHCAHDHGEENLYDALAHSCNIYFYNTGLIVGGETMSEWAKKFGLDTFTGIDLPYEKTGFVPSPVWKSKKLKSTWFTGDTLNLSIGQGFIETTPLENIIAFNVFAANGYLIKPYLLKKVDNINSEVLTKLYLGISSKIIDIVKRGLIDAVDREKGTAHYLKELDLKIAGKTGTAQTSGLAHGWFLGFFPYDKPKYTVCTFLENCGSSFYAVKTSHDFLKQLQEQNLLL